MGALVVGQMRRLAEAFVTRVTFVRLLASVHPFMTSQLGQMPKRLMAHRALIGPVWCRGLKRWGGRSADRGTASRRLPSGGLLRVGGRGGGGDVSRARTVGLLTD